MAISSRSKKYILYTFVGVSIILNLWAVSRIIFSPSSVPKDYVDSILALSGNSEVRELDKTTEGLYLEPTVDCQARLYQEYFNNDQNADVVANKKEIMKAFQSFDEGELNEAERYYSKIYKKGHLTAEDHPSSGYGSTPLFTIAFRCKLAKIINDYKIDTIIDMSCGDWTWMRYFVQEHPEVNYIGSDGSRPMVDHHNEKYAHLTNAEFFFAGDMSKPAFWETVKAKSKFYGKGKRILAFVRHTLQHNYMAVVKDILTNVNENSGAMFFMSSNYLFVEKNKDIGIHLNFLRYKPYNLLLKPFYLPAPLETTFENTIPGIKEDIFGGLGIKPYVFFSLWKLPFDGRSWIKEGYWVKN